MGSVEQVLTAHARRRMRGRGIRPEALEALLEFGREAFDHHGGVVLYFDKRARRRAGGGSDVYAVLGMDGRVMTVGHRLRRVNRA